MKRLFRLTNIKTGKASLTYYDNKQKAKAARDKSTTPMKVTAGPDHWRNK